MDEARIIRMVEYIASHGTAFGRVVTRDGLYDRYAVGFEDGGFVYVNDSPREGCEYTRSPLTAEQAWAYLIEAGMTETE